MEQVREYARSELAALLPRPQADANKYTRGKVVLVAGDARYPGAACLAARASQRTGAGYTEVWCAPEAVPIVRGAAASLVVRPWDELAQLARLERACEQPADAAFPITPNDGSLTASSRALFPDARASHPLAYAVGCGFDARDEATAALTRLVLRRAQAPVVVDGGGLAALSAPEGRDALRARFVDGLPTVITPHAGEAARLAAPLGLPLDDPARAARLLSLALGATVLLKGPDSYLSDGETVVRMAEGTPALAKAGTGDVLAGMVAALLAEGLDALDACVLAATLHARAGREAARLRTDLCVIAEDVVEAIPCAVADLLADGAPPSSERPSESRDRGDL